MVAEELKMALGLPGTMQRLFKKRRKGEEKRKRRKDRKEKGKDGERGATTRRRPFVSPDQEPQTGRAPSEPVYK